MTIVFDGDDCHKVSKAIEKEWLETNGIGGYASSTTDIHPWEKKHKCRRSRIFIGFFDEQEVFFS